MRALITGGASGIGRATGERLARDGARIALLDRDLDGAERSASAIRAAGGECVPLQVDVESRSSVSAAVSAATEALGGLDACITAAGVFAEVPVEEIDEPTWERMTGIVMTGTFLVCQAVIPALRAAGGGSIVTITSAATITGSHGAAHYGAAKGGVLGLTLSLCHQLAPFGIRVNAVCPGPTRTPLFGDEAEQQRKEEALSAHIPLGRMADPAEIAAVVAFVAGPEASFMTGAHIVVDGGYSRG